MESNMSNKQTEDSRLEALGKVDCELLSEHFSKVRTATKSRHGDYPLYTAVIREENGEPYVSSVLKHQSGEHFMPDGKVVLSFCLSGHPFMEKDEYRRHLKYEISTRRRQLKPRRTATL